MPWNRTGTWPCSTTWSRRAREPPLDRVHLDPDVRNRRAVERLTRKPWRRLRRAVDALTDEPSDPELHEVRKRAKQARYAYEATAPIIGKAAGRLAKELAGLQDVLGAHQDAVVATDWLYQAAVEIGDARTGYAAGRLAQIFDDERRAACRVETAVEARPQGPPVTGQPCSSAHYRSGDRR